MIDSNIKYGQWLIDWLDVYKKPNVKATTLKTIEICLRLHIPDSIKDMPFNSITAFTIQKALNSVTSTRMRLFVYDIYANSFKRALQLGILKKNPMEIVDKVKHIRKQGEPLNKIEIMELLSKINNNRLKPLILFYLYTGVRRSEALSLQWQYIDYDRQTLTIQGTKTLKSNRTIPLFKPLESLLKALPRENSYIFNYSPEYISRKFHKLCPAHKLHDLRHTFATRCLECGISIRVVQQWLGHTRLDTTASIYTHILDNFNKAEAQKFKLF